MPKKMSYRKEQLPDYIEKLKSMVERNFEVMIKPVESVISEDKYYNIVKGRRMAAEQSIWGLKKVDACYKELENLHENELSSYYRESLPNLIENLKEMCLLNLEIIDIELNPHEDDFNRLLDVEDQLEEMFGKELTNDIIRAGKYISVKEDKLHNVIKSRELAAKDYDWGLTKIDELENELTIEEEEKIKVSWAKRAAQQNTGRKN